MKAPGTTGAQGRPDAPQPGSVSPLSSWPSSHADASVPVTCPVPFPSPGELCFLLPLRASSGPGTQKVTVDRTVHLCPACTLGSQEDGRWAGAQKRQAGPRPF